MPTAEDVFSETYGRFIKNWAFITSLRQVAEVALPTAEEALAAIHADFVERASIDPQYKKIIVNLDGTEAAWGDEVKKLLGAGMTQNAIANATTAINAASLVFAESVLDDCVWSFLKVCSLVSPADWEQFIANRKVSFASFCGKTREAVRAEMIEEKLTQIERDSLLGKIDLLFQLCTPPKGFAPIRNYVYDRDRLAKIDDARHGIVHRDGLGKPVAGIDDDLDFISKTANYLLGIVNQKYGVQLNVMRVFNLRIPPEPLQ